MRVGFNPKKDQEIQKSDYLHQVVVPVYIPNQEGYFKDSFQILKICLASLFKTCHSQTYISVVNNGSCPEVFDYLNDLFKDNKIHEIIHTNNIGKLNAILKATTGHQFQLTTITDCDVLFLNNWQSETYKVFKNFKKVGVVSPTPSPRLYKNLTHNIIFDHFFSKKLQITTTKNPEAIQKFAYSIGNVNFYNQNHCNKNLTVCNNNCFAVIGAGHFVATYKSSIFDQVKLKYTNFNLGGDSEYLILDKPAVDQGFWRLSTHDNFAYHLGNTLEPWMYEVLNEVIQEIKQTIKVPIDEKIKINKIKTAYIYPVFQQIINRKKFWNWFLAFKGLTNIEVKEY